MMLIYEVPNRVFDKPLGYSVWMLKPRQRIELLLWHERGRNLNWKELSWKKHYE